MVQFFLAEYGFETLLEPVFGTTARAGTASRFTS
jgi:hypothetical protein